MKRGILFVVCCWLAWAAPAWGTDVPHLINFQGRLDDASGQTVSDGSYSVTFRLFDDPFGGTQLWIETQDVTTVGGLFTVLLGADNPILETAFDVDSCYLEVQPAGSDPIVPRARVTSVAYARIAGTARLLGTATPEDLEESAEITDAIAGHGSVSDAHHSKTVSASELGVGTLAEERLPQNAIDSTEIQDGSLTRADLLDEPGIAHSHTTLTPLSSTMKIVDSAMLVVPSFGYVVVLASGWFYELHSDGAETSAMLSLSTSRTTHDTEHTARFEVRGGAPVGHTTENFLIQSVKTVTKGQQFKLFLLGNKTGTGFPNVQNVNLNTMYFPTSYGEIDIPAFE